MAGPKLNTTAGINQVFSGLRQDSALAALLGQRVAQPQQQGALAAILGVQEPAPEQGSPLSMIIGGLRKDFDDAVQGVQSAVSSLGAPGRAYRGEYDQVEIDPVTGAVSPFDPRMIDDAAELAGTIAVSGAPMVRPANSLGMFGGVSAKTADHGALARAKEMAANGADRDAVWQETGWFTGPDGKWRFEIDDHLAFFKGEATPAELTEARGSSAQDVFRHNPLFAAYPDTADIQIEGIKRSAHLLGRYRPAGLLDLDAAERIGINKRIAGGDADSVMLHELQHAIQEREGFASGGNTSQFADMPDAQAVSDARVLASIIKRGTPPDEAAAAFLNMVGRDAAPEARQLVRENISDLDALYRMPADPMDAYKRLPGEVEARNVQTRRNMTPAERRSKAPWTTQDVDDKNQIIRLNT